MNQIEPALPNLTRWSAKMGRRRKQEAIMAWLFIAPTVIGFLVFSVGPLIWAAVMSFYKWDVMSPPVWVGWQNYIGVLTNQWPYTIWRAIGNTLWYVLLIPVGISVNMIMAVLCVQDTRFNRAFRTIVFLPSIVSGVAMVLVWGEVFYPWGLVNQFLTHHGHQPLLVNSSPAYFISVVTMMGIWAGAGGMGMMIIINALNNIPKTLYESARLEGASSWTLFRKITFPLITPALFFMIVTGIPGTLQGWITQYMVLSFTSQGGVSVSQFDPSNVVAGYYVVQNTPFFAGTALNVGFGIASGFVIGAFIMLTILMNLWLQKKWVHYDLY